MTTPSIVIISGASRGLGLAAAAQLSKAFPTSAFHLMASSIERLEVAKSALSGHKGPVSCHGVELSKLAAGDASGCSALMRSLSSAGQQNVLFVHSAAVLGPTGAVETLGAGSIAAVSQAVQVNVAGSLALATLIVGSLPNGLKVR